MATIEIGPQSSDNISFQSPVKSADDLKRERKNWVPPTHLDPLYIAHKVVGGALDHAEKMQEIRQGEFPTQQLLRTKQTPLHVAITAVRRFVSTITQPHF